MKPIGLLFLVLFDTLLTINAIKVHITAKSSAPVDRRRLRSRAQIAGTNSNSNLTGQAVINNQNTVYITEIELGGINVSVLIDTGR